MIDKTQVFCYYLTAMSSFSDPNFTIFGRNPDGVLELLKERKRRKTNNDGRKFGLIIEGGGMRGIVAGGALLALYEYAGAEIFDVVYGTSAGALSGAFFLSGQIQYGVAIFYEDLATEKFINLARIPPKFEIDYLINIIEHKRKLDISAVKRNATELMIAATDITTGEQHYISSRDDTSILTAIKASCALPIFYDKPIEIKGNRYLDGGTINDLLVRKAIDDGCTDILILFTRPRERPRRASKVLSFIEAMELRKYGPRFAATFFNRDQAYEKALNCIEETENIRTAVVAPHFQTLTISTINKKRLKRTSALSYQFMRGVLKNY